MPVRNSSVVFHQNTILRVSLPTVSNHKLCILIHGWNGDENSMQIFSSDVPENYVLIAPRAFYSTEEGGYTWIPSLTRWAMVSENEDFPLKELVSSAQRLLQAIPEWIKLLDLNISEIELIGFSQGAALSYLLGLSSPNQFNKIISLAGFLPEGAGQWYQTSNIKNKKILIAHGTQDEVVPVQKARDSAALLSQWGADVDYCEDKTRHTISMSCRRRIKLFFQENNPE
jgi:phospholipase/carboxylesterase